MVLGVGGGCYFICGFLVEVNREVVFDDIVGVVEFWLFLDDECWLVCEFNYFV